MYTTHFDSIITVYDAQCCVLYYITLGASYMDYTVSNMCYHGLSVYHKADFFHLTGQNPHSYRSFSNEQEMPQPSDRNR